MALYVPAGRRRRNLIVGLVAAVVVGLVTGALIGRVTAPTVDDRVTTVQDDARSVVGAVAATPNEYRQLLAGSNEFRGGGGVDDALTSARSSLVAALDDAIWLGPNLRREATDAMDAVVAAERAKVSQARYEAAVARATSRIETVFGIDG
jgi:hypothetical protein